MPEGTPNFKVEVLDEDEQGLMFAVSDEEGEVVGQVDVEIPGRTAHNGSTFTITVLPAERLFVSGISSHERINNGSYDFAMSAVSAYLKEHHPKFGEVIGLDGEVI